MKFVLLFVISSLIIFIIISLIFNWRSVNKKALIASGSAVFVLIIYYWLTYNNFTVTITAVNNSARVFDSIRFTTFPNRSFTFYNIKPGQSVTHSFEYRNFFYPRGEHGAASIKAYTGSFYSEYYCGVIDAPFALLHKEYKFYLHDKGINERPEIEVSEEPINKI